MRIEMEGMEAEGFVRVLVGEVEAEILAASSRFVVIRAPESGSGELLVSCNGRQVKSRLNLGTLVASELHPVSNPVLDQRGNVYVTYSGTRGEQVPFGIFVVSPAGEKEPFLGDITNPTGLAIGPDNLLYVSSRHTGTIYRSTFDRRVEKYADGLGIASGLVFDGKGNLYVGDRGGTIYKITPSQEVSHFCEIEPSVSAFHLAMDQEGYLFCSGPTLATQDCIYRISPLGKVEVYFKGFGRPQGLALSPDGLLQVAGSYKGRKGVYTLIDGSPKLYLASSMLVGLAYNPTGDRLYLVDNESLFSIGVR